MSRMRKPYRNHKDQPHQEHHGSSGLMLGSVYEDLFDLNIAYVTDVMKTIKGIVIAATMPIDNHLLRSRTKSIVDLLSTKYVAISFSKVLVNSTSVLLASERALVRAEIPFELKYTSSIVRSMTTDAAYDWGSETLISWSMYDPLPLSVSQHALQATQV